MEQTVSDLVRQGVAALKAGDKATARNLLEQASEKVPHNQNVWLWLSDTVETQEEQRALLQRVVDIDEQSQPADIARKKLSRLPSPPSAEPEHSPDATEPTPEAQFAPDQPAVAEETDPEAAESEPWPDIPSSSKPPLLEPLEPLDSEHAADEAEQRRTDMLQAEMFQYDQAEPAGGAEDPDAQLQDDRPAWQRWLNTPLGWATVAAVVILLLVSTWFIGLVILNSDTPDEEQVVITAADVIERFRTNDLEVANPRPMQDADYGLAPRLCQETSERFFMPRTLGNPEAGGRVFVCDDVEDTVRLQTFYEEQPSSSWLFRRENILLQLNEAVPENLALRYEAALNELVLGEPVVEAPTTPTLEDTPVVIVATPTPGQPTPTPELLIVTPTPEVVPTIAVQPVVSPIPPPTAEQPAVPTATETPAPAVPTAVPQATATIPPPPTETATTAPTPTLEPVELSGDGSVVTQPFMLPAETSRVQIDYTGEAGIIVRAYAQGNQEDETPLVDTNGPYSGSRLLQGAQEYELEVEADSAWTITIEGIPDAGQPIQQLSSTTDLVSNRFTPATTDTVSYRFEYTGTEQAVVTLHCAGGDQEVINQSGPVEQDVSVTFSQGPCFWEVRASGDWQLGPQ